MSDKNIKMIHMLADKVNACNGVAYYVGGCVRDSIMGITQNKDIDIEVHNIPPQKLEEILDSIGKRIEIGKSFGVYNIKGCDVDIAMPRQEHKTGTHHRDFDILINPYIGTKSAAKRRDFTINALMKNILTGQIIDHFGGLSDIKSKTIRHINDETFTEDSLRVMRAAQFAARLEFDIDAATLKLCSKMDVSTLARERVFEELKKALLSANKPSVFFESLRKMNKLDEWFPELKQLIGLEQNKKYHKEGDVWTHTMLVLDEAAKVRNKTENPIAFMLTALTHDIGKIVCFEVKNGVIHSYAHETEGLPLISKFLHRLTSDKVIIKYVLNLSSLHMKPNIMALSNSGIKVTNKMFDSTIDPVGLILLSQCDKKGQINDKPKTDTLPFLTERYEIYKEYMSRPYVTGKDLIDNGIEPNDKFTDILAFTHKLRLAGVNKKTALKQALSMKF